MATNLRLVGEAVVDDEVPTFASFWLLYPKKVSKFKAEQLWRKLKPSEQSAAILALTAWRQIWLARREMEFVPYPSTWIYQHRWEDELPENWGVSHASHVAAKVPEQGERQIMPQHVKDLLAKLRK